MTSLPSRVMTERLRDAEALFRFDSSAGRTALVDVATELLSEGVSLAGIVALAGDDHADLGEVEQDLRSVLRELRLAPLDVGSAAIRQCREIARDVLEGRRPARPAAVLIWTIYVEAGGPDELTEFAYVADGLDDLPGLISEQEFRGAAEGIPGANQGLIDAAAGTGSSDSSGRLEPAQRLTGRWSRAAWSGRTVRDHRPGRRIRDPALHFGRLGAS